MKPRHLRNYLLLSLLASTHAMADAPVTSCADLVNAAIPHTTIASAAIDGGQTSSTFSGAGAMPENCVVKGVIEPRTGVVDPDTGSDQYGTHFELRLPTDWNGRFFFQGGGGTDGYVVEADGPVVSQANDQQIPALWRGYAVISTDAGHTSANDQTAMFKSGFGVDPQARLDYGYRSIGVATGVAKALIDVYYGSEPSHSYFVGCSKGGQEAMQASQVYGDEFDGIVAGDPGMRLPQAAVNQVADVQILAQTAKKMSPLAIDITSGEPLLSGAFSTGDLNLIANAVTQACDNLDGLADGLIFRPEACQKAFDPATLQCKAFKTASCLAPVQVAALKQIMAGATDSAGKPLYNSFFYDTGINSSGFGGWAQWKIGFPHWLINSAMNIAIGEGAMQYIFSTPPNPGMSIFDADINALDAATRATGTDPSTSVVYGTSAVDFMYANNPNLDALRAHGGKLILYHGASDPVFSIKDTLNYYSSLQQRYGVATDNFARMFIVPGMGHCLDGSRSANSFDALTALENWVEHGVAPDRMVARAGNATFGPNSLPDNVTRPLCAYPLFARYKGFGDTNDAGSFICSSL